MEQRLVQSPQMIQAMQVLQLSTLALVERIEQEMLENPFIEERDGSDEYDGDRDRDSSEAEGGGVESMIEVLERYERDFGDGRRTGSGGEEGDRKLEAMRNTPARATGLGEALRESLPMLQLDDDHMAIASYLTDSLDHRGYLTDDFEEIARNCGVDGATDDDVELALWELRHATHPALGARDLQECLLLQAQAADVDPLVVTLIEDHIDNITTNRLPRIARATEATLEEVKEAIRTIQGFDPLPSREYGGSMAETIHPDVVVEEVDGEFVVRLTRDGVPRLTISPAYKQLLAESKRGDSVRKWVKERLENARWFLDALQQRESTLERVAKAVFARQQGFLRNGVRGLVPLRMQEIADETNVHISTVSRAVAGKYAQTPNGIFALRSFFSGGTETEDGDMASQASIQSRIQDLVDKEDPTQPLSDDRLAQQLKSEHGITIARRTVTKYRKALSIPSSTQRKRY